MTANESYQYIVFKIKWRTVQSLVDSGSPKSLMSQRLAHQLNLKIYLIENQEPLVSTSGQALKLMGKSFVPCSINGLSVNYVIIIVKHIFFKFNSWNIFLSHNQAIINYRNNTIDILDGLILLPLQKFQSIDNCAVINKHIIIPKYSEVIIPIKISKV